MDGTPTMTSTHANKNVPLAGLSTLPPELKREIVRHTHEADLCAIENRDIVEVTRRLVYELEDLKRPTQPKFPNVEALSRVDVAFAELCFPILWREVNLYGKNEADLNYFLHVILPRHRESIRSVVGVQYPLHEVDRETPQYVTSAISAINESRTLQDGFSTLLAANTLRRPRGLGFVYIEAEAKQQPFSRFILTLAHVDESLSELSLRWQVLRDYDHHESVFANLIRNFRHLTSLELIDLPIIRPTPEQSGTELVMTLSGLERLQAFTLSGPSGWFDARYLATPWRSKLQHLRFINTDPMDVLFLFTFASQFRDSLNGFFLEEVAFYHDNDFNFQAPEFVELLRFPKLTDFMLGVHYCGPELLKAVSLPSLHNVTIGYCDGMALLDWQEFIIRHRSSLKEVWAGGECYWELYELEEMSQSLTEKNISSMSIWEKKRDNYYKLQL